MKTRIFLIFLLLFGCLKAKKSPFDINSPIGLLFAFYTSQSSSQSSSSIIITVSAAYSTNGLNWNDYINRDFSKDIFSQADTACNTANTGGYRTCVHAGEIRKFDIASRATCTGLSATDSLSALNWVCKVNANGGITFYSSALNKGKYLSDLIDWTTNAWKSLTITLKDGTTTLAVSNALKLWTNVIDASGTINPSVGGTIYIYKSNVTAGQIRVNVADKVAVVFKPGTIYTIGTANSANPAILVANNFSWIEGSIEGKFYDNGLRLTSKFSVIKNFKVQHCSAVAECVGILMSGAKCNYLEDVMISNMGTITTNGGFNIGTASNNNFFNNIILANNAAAGINSSSSTGNVFYGVTVMNSASDGIALSVANDNTLLNLTSVNNTGSGVISNNGGNLLFINSFVANQTTGMSYSSGAAMTTQNIAASNNTTQIFLNTTTTYFTGIVKTSTTTCSYAASGGGMNSTCIPVSPSDFTAPLNIASIASTFVGLSATDAKNTSSGLSGSSGLTYASVSDWINFDTFFKGAGNTDGTAFPTSGHRGKCSGGVCATIYDFSLKSTDTVLRNANIISSGAACPSATNMITHTFTTGNVTFLRNSVELLNDGVGNDNGLCEANEDCLLTPNIGSYQGHGNLVAASTVSGCADVTSQGIKLYQYVTNGY